MAKPRGPRARAESLPPLVFMDALDGFPLGSRVYDPLPDGARARATLLVASATGVLQTYYARFANEAARAGFRVLTFDYRGIGSSKHAPLGARGFDATMTEWAKLDATGALRVARAFGDPVILVGHSFGGQTLGLADELLSVDGALLVGAQLGFFGHWPLGARARYAAFWYALLPSASEVFGYLPGKLGVGEDLPKGVALQWARWCRHPGYFLADHPEAADRMHAFHAPTLLYSFSDDAYAPPGAIDAYVAHFTPGTILHRRMRPRDAGVRSMGHFGFFRPGQGGKLWNEALGFASDVAEGRALRIDADTLREPFGIGMDDIMKDLSFGRDR